MNRSLAVATTLLALCAPVTGCGILSPEAEEVLVVRGTVYVNGQPAGGRLISLYHNRRVCPLACDGYRAFISSTTTMPDGSYDVEARPNGVWSCDTSVFVTVDYGNPSESVRGCVAHEGVDFHLTEAEPLLMSGVH